MKTDKENIYDMIYQIVRHIPPGKVTTYGAIAACLGLKSGARMVGYALSSGHNIPDLPAHRVVNRIGLLSGKHHFGTPERMKQLLEEEGVNIENDLIQNFKNHYWDPAIGLAL